MLCPKCGSRLKVIRTNKLSNCTCRNRQCIQCGYENDTTEVIDLLDNEQQKTQLYIEQRDPATQFFRGNQ